MHYSFVLDLRHTWEFFQFVRTVAPSVQSGSASGNVFGERGTNCFQSLVSHQKEDLSYRGDIVAENQMNLFSHMAFLQKTRLSSWLRAGLSTGPHVCAAGLGVCFPYIPVRVKNTSSRILLPANYRNHNSENIFSCLFSKIIS